jgi:mRNA interferase HigB
MLCTLSVEDDCESSAKTMRTPVKRSMTGMTANQANWQNLIEVQQIYPKAEAVNNFTVFNIKGNRYRLIADIQYSKQLIYVKYILTHAEYDKEQWKNDPYY